MARRSRAWLAGAALLIAQAPGAGAIELSLPADCEPGKSCFVQQYADLDPGPGAKDYACGAETYDGHDGLDLRVRTLKDVERGVAVLAAAAGTVIGLRDGVPDHLLRSEADREAVAGLECGNGVLIDHGGGWQSQYCHMRRGSVRVGKGERVEAGQALGSIGYSGAAAFPHVHLTVRHNGKPVDPFRGEGAPEACGLGPEPLWKPAAVKALAYRPGEILDVGFSAGRVAMEGLELGIVQSFVPDRSSAALVAWGWAINLQKGDRITVKLSGPGGEIARNEASLDRNKAQFLLFGGGKRPGEAWPAGDYVASFEVVRAGRTALSASRPVTLE
jgi:hypothetical protein